MTNPGYVYIVHGRDTTYIKVGQTTQIMARLETLQEGVPFHLDILLVRYVGDMAREEQLLLEEYAPYHVRGEWFDLGDDFQRFWPVARATTAHHPLSLAPRTVHSIESARIIEILRGQAEPVSIAEIMHAGALPDGQYGTIRQMLSVMVKKGRIHRVSQGRYSLQSMETHLHRWREQATGAAQGI